MTQAFVSIDISIYRINPDLPLDIEQFVSSEIEGVACVSYCDVLTPRNIQTWYPEDELPESLFDLFFKDYEIIMFDCIDKITIWKRVLVEQFGFPALNLDRILCLKQGCSFFNYDCSDIDIACSFTNCTVRRNENEIALAKTLTTSANYIHSNKVEDEVVQHNSQTICLMQIQLFGCFLIPIPAFERLLMFYTLEMSQISLHFDINLCTVGAELKTLIEEKRDKLCKEYTGGVVSKMTQDQQLLKWIADVSGESPENSLKKVKLLPLIFKYQNFNEKGKDIHSLLLLRLDTNFIPNLTRYKYILDNAKDGKMQVGMKYCGATTGRWTSSGFQVQNLPASKSLMESNIEELYNYSAKVKQEGDITDFSICKTLSACVRGSLTASPKKKLLSIDFSSIEPRCVAWLTHHDSLLDQFRSNTDVYVSLASKLYSVSEEEVSSKQRGVGKLLVNAGNYGIGLQALAEKLNSPQYKLNMTTDDTFQLLTAHKREIAPIVQLWGGLERTAIACIKTPQKEHFVNGSRISIIGNNNIDEHSTSLMFSIYTEDGRLHPSVLTLNGCIVKEGNLYQTARAFKGEKKTYDRLLSSTWGGSFTALITQKLARDILGLKICSLERYRKEQGLESKFRILFLVHDEVVIELDETDNETADSIIELFEENLEGYESLPIASTHWQGLRYKS